MQLIENSYQSVFLHTHRKLGIFQYFTLYLSLARVNTSQHVIFILLLQKSLLIVKVKYICNLYKLDSVQVFTSKIFGMTWNWHQRRNFSLSKSGSILQISVSTSDISVGVNIPPIQVTKKTRYKTICVTNGQMAILAHKQQGAVFLMFKSFQGKNDDIHSSRISI